jgi:hypothetical protein
MEAASLLLTLATLLIPFVSGAFALSDSLVRKTPILNSLLWAAGATVLPAVFIPIWLAVRPLKPGQTREGGTGWNILKNFALTWTVLMAYACFLYVISVGSAFSELKTDAELAGGGIGMMLGMAIIGAIWFFPMIGAIVIGFFIKKSNFVETGLFGIH